MAETIAETERLRLRNWDYGDLDEFLRHTNTEAVMRWLGGVWPREKHEAAFGRIKTYEREYGWRPAEAPALPGSEAGGAGRFAPAGTR